MMSEVSSPMFAGQFEGCSVLVTGAASGIGLGVGHAFALSGATVTLLDKSPAVKAAAGQLCDAGLDVRGVEADVTDEAAIRTAMADLTGIGLDVLVNNAGIITISPFEELSLGDIRRVIEVNLTSAFTCSQAALPLLRKSQRAVILNAASGQARDGFIYTPHYAASKFGIMGFTQSLAKELARESIRVNAYCPGIVRTDMWAYNDAEWGRLLGFEPGALIEKWISEIPLGRAAEVSDVSNLLLFLASDAASYITGQTVNIDGGMFMN